MKKYLFTLLYFALLQTNVQGQTRIATSRKTGKPISTSSKGKPGCEYAEIGCDKVAPDYENASLHCLNCLLAEADTVMTHEILKLQKQYILKNKDFSPIEKDQIKWEKETENAADKESETYKGGSMEMSEYVRIKLLLTKKRIEYIENMLTADLP